MKNIKVAGILGGSYSGSTVMCLLQNTHPDIYGGGELYRLRSDRDIEVKCSYCGPDCELWTPENIARVKNVEINKFYQTIADITGSNLISDSSKVINHFDEDLLSTSVEKGTDFEFFVSMKHPIRLMVSHLFTKYFVKNGIKNFFECYELWDEKSEELLENVRQSVLPLKNRYINIFDQGNVIHKYGQVNRVKLEELVENPTVYLNQTADFFGVKRSDMSEDFAEAEFIHPTGGNSGPLIQAKISAGELKKYREGSRQEYYKKKQGLSADNKFLSIVPEKYILKICDMEEIQEFNEILGYTREEIETLLDDERETRAQDRERFRNENL